MVGKKARTCYLSRGAENRSWQALKESEERQMNFTERRKQVFDKMDQDSALLLFSGIELRVSVLDPSLRETISSPPPDLFNVYQNGSPDAV